MGQCDRLSLNWLSLSEQIGADGATHRVRRGFPTESRDHRLSHLQAKGGKVGGVGRGGGVPCCMSTLIFCQCRMSLSLISPMSQVKFKKWPYIFFKPMSHIILSHVGLLNSSSDHVTPSILDINTHITLRSNVETIWQSL